MPHRVVYMVKMAHIITADVGMTEVAAAAAEEAVAEVGINPRQHQSTVLLCHYATCSPR